MKDKGKKEKIAKALGDYIFHSLKRHNKSMAACLKNNIISNKKVNQENCMDVLKGISWRVYTTTT